jgi:hypothetical protein
MTLTEIKAAIENGKKVFWSNPTYEVIRDARGQYLIQHANGHCIGLTWQDGRTMNGKEEDFYSAKEIVLPESINTEEEAKQYIRMLADNSALYHFDDDANDLEIDLFNFERDHMNELSAQLFNFPGFDPFSYALEVLKELNPGHPYFFPSKNQFKRD